MSDYRLVPANNAVAKATMKDTAHPNGLHDTMRFGVRSLAAEANGRNPLQGRLENVRPPSCGGLEGGADGLRSGRRRRTA